MIGTPKQLGKTFATNLLEMGVIDRYDLTTVADVIATAIVEDRLGEPQDEEDTLP